jgi:hypothetical protein
MATYAAIQSWVHQRHGFAPKTCWIAHGKEMAGVPVRRAWNRGWHERTNPCPPEKLPAIMAAFRHFGMA